MGVLNKNNKLYGIFNLKCPACHNGDLFKSKSYFPLTNLTDMPNACPNCGEDFIRETGFYFGAMYVSYFFCVAYLLPLYIILHWGFNLAFWPSIGLCLLVQLFLTPYLFRLSRSIWIHIFVQLKNLNNNSEK